MRYAWFVLLLIVTQPLLAQSVVYQQKKAEKLARDSPFTRIIARELPAHIVYEDAEIIAFEPLHKQAPVHLLIVPKKRIPTINDLTDADALLVGRMHTVARQLALAQGIAESGYRLSINTNEDAGQSVFHLHLHLMGGRPLGPMVGPVDQEE